MFNKKNIYKKNLKQYCFKPKHAAKLLNNTVLVANDIVCPANSIVCVTNSVVWLVNSIVFATNSIVCVANSIVSPVNSIVCLANSIASPANSMVLEFYLLINFRTALSAIHTRLAYRRQQVVMQFVPRVNSTSSLAPGLNVF